MFLKVTLRNLRREKLYAVLNVAGFALGKRFRFYTLATVVTVVALSALTAPYAARLAAGLPTPGFGIVERVTVYASLMWMAVLAITLLRRSVPHAADVLV